jgi:hypothetical protein
MGTGDGQVKSGQVGFIMMVTRITRPVSGAMRAECYPRPKMRTALCADRPGRLLSSGPPQAEPESRSPRSVAGWLVPRIALRLPIRGSPSPGPASSGRRPRVCAHRRRGAGLQPRKLIGDAEGPGLCQTVHWQ